MYIGSVQIPTPGKALLYLISFVSAAMLIGCMHSSARLNRVEIGMSRGDLLEVMGKPHSVSAQGDTEYLNYNLDNKRMGDRREYCIRLVGNKVESFGEKSEFTTTKFLVPIAVVSTGSNTPAIVVPVSQNLTNKAGTNVLSALTPAAQPTK